MKAELPYQQLSLHALGHRAITSLTQAKTASMPNVSVEYYHTAGMSVTFSTPPVAVEAHTRRREGNARCHARMRSGMRGYKLNRMPLVLAEES